MMGEQNFPMRIPDAVAGYIICERLGSGSFSNVFKAISSTADHYGVRKTAAVKAIDMHAANSSKLSSDCVISEIKILKTLKHRNIVHLYDFQWDRNNIYLIMEYCGGGDLGRFIKQFGPLSEQLTRKFFRQLAAAVQYMRALNIAHMDFKPQNILLTNLTRPSIKISDFGLSLYIETGGRASSFRGSPLYMAPEIIARRHYDSRVDLWSIGVILYECLYSFPPFNAVSYEKLTDQILYEPIVYRSSIILSTDCLNLLQALLVREAEKRITFEKFFTHPFISLGRLKLCELEKAGILMEKSLSAEANNNLVEATKFLMEAIQMKIGCLEFYEEGPEKANFRENIKSDLDRAENMKQKMRATIKETIFFSEDESKWDDVPQVKAAELVVKAAQLAQSSEKWDEALDKYKLAIECVLKILSDIDKQSGRAIALQSKVSSWLSSAERIKMYLEILSEDGLGSPSSIRDNYHVVEKISSLNISDKV